MATETAAAFAMRTPFWERLVEIEDRRRRALTELLSWEPDDEASQLLMAEIQRSAEIVYQIAKQGRAASARR